MGWARWLFRTELDRHFNLCHSIPEARALGCARVARLSEATNEGAMRFERRAGFTRSQMVHCRLGLARERADCHG